MARKRKIRTGSMLRHTTSSFHNPNEIKRWEEITGKGFVCCVKKSPKMIPKGPNKGRKINSCGIGKVGAHVRMSDSNRLYIVPVCDKHNDNGWRGNCFSPGDWFYSKSTIAVPAKNKRNPKNKSYRKKKRKRKRNMKIRTCTKSVKGHGRCHLHKNQRKGKKRIRKGICGAKIN